MSAHNAPTSGETGTAVDLFGGPGGWDEAARALGIVTIGIEHDASACRTRSAAGHLTIRADVSQYPPERFIGFGGVIASPPCPTFSAAGKGSGTEELDYLIACIRAGEWADPWAFHQWEDPRTPLVLEPLRWVDIIRPRWVALEQVPAVLPIWEATAERLRSWGYSTWTGVLNAADYGVPQTRKRAILTASLDVTAHCPPPTHAKHPTASLWAEPEQPWVSMAEALGWGMTERPMPTVTGGGCANGGPEPIARGGRALLEKERGGVVVALRRVRGAGMTERNGERPDAPIDGPAHTLTSKARSDVWVVDRRTNSRGAGGGTVPTVPVPMSEPAPTLTGKSGQQWVLRSGSTVAGGPLAERPVDEPALTVTSRADLWVFDRPATTIVASFRPDIVAAPGYRNKVPRQNAEGSVKITEREALILQSFDPDYPVQGNRSKRFEQIGNAVPPRLAGHVLASLVSHNGGQS